FVTVRISLVGSQGIAGRRPQFSQLRNLIAVEIAGARLTWRAGSPGTGVTGHCYRVHAVDDAGADAHDVTVRGKLQSGPAVAGEVVDGGEPRVRRRPIGKSFQRRVAFRRKA